MNPLVYMILTAERNMRVQQENYRQKVEAGIISESVPQPKQKNRKRIITHSQSQKECECS